MWETTSSFTRAALLALFTAAFAAAWNGDRRSQAEFALARRNAWQERSEYSLAASVQWPTPAGTTSCDLRTSVRPVTVLMELPADIAPGRYRVVESCGRVMNIIVPRGADSCMSSRGDSTRDWYRFDLADGSRRYFIRTNEAGSGLRSTAAAKPASRRR